MSEHVTVSASTEATQSVCIVANKSHTKRLLAKGVHGSCIQALVQKTIILDLV